MSQHQQFVRLPPILPQSKLVPKSNFCESTYGTIRCFGFLSFCFSFDYRSESPWLALQVLVAGCFVGIIIIIAEMSARPLHTLTCTSLEKKKKSRELGERGYCTVPYATKTPSCGSHGLACSLLEHTTVRLNKPEEGGTVPNGWMLEHRT
ncbi:hypothetical protein L873DRAFT_1248112 [Choiromyces venosus 120613-1]|uniref:Uncharacterized protein n=1 Tax=Choiromyces venosus 120613-1 TaxID=1336337 RepID=A0A3N4JQQ6_9PEZI|nr:hypothetical protein L873DRAFT_1248112 [Choiromyces venosus 120613-1]